MDEPVPSKPDSGESEPSSVEEQRPPGKVIAISEHQVFEASYSGPVPPPAILRGYEDLVPGAAARLLAQAERQTDHRIRLERTVVESGAHRSWAGLWCGFALAMTTIIGGCILVGLGHDGAGATIATGGVAALAGVFVYGTSQQRRERQEKASMAPPPDAQ